MKSKATPSAPDTLNKQTSKVTTNKHSFFDQKWGNAMQGMTCMVECHSNPQLASILKAAKLVAHELEPETENMDQEASEDEYGQISVEYMKDPKLVSSSKA
ncbi:hypothetical protein V8E55_010021 [Tylopilus felleus]